jgi:hypothetical protein
LEENIFKGRKRAERGEELGVKILKIQILIELRGFSQRTSFLG